MWKLIHSSSHSHKAPPALWEGRQVDSRQADINHSRIDAKWLTSPCREEVGRMGTWLGKLRLGHMGKFGEVLHIHVQSSGWLFVKSRGVTLWGDLADGPLSTCVRPNFYSDSRFSIRRLFGWDEGSGRLIFDVTITLRGVRGVRWNGTRSYWRDIERSAWAASFSWHHHHHAPTLLPLWNRCRPFPY